MNQSWKSTRLKISKSKVSHSLDVGEQGFSATSMCLINLQNQLFPGSNRQEPNNQSAASGWLPTILPLAAHRITGAPLLPPSPQLPSSPVHLESPRRSTQPAPDMPGKRRQHPPHRRGAKVAERPGNTRACPATPQRTANSDTQVSSARHQNSSEVPPKTCPTPHSGEPE